MAKRIFAQRNETCKRFHLGKPNSCRMADIKVSLENLCFVKVISRHKQTAKLAVIPMLETVKKIVNSGIFAV